MDQRSRAVGGGRGGGRAGAILAATLGALFVLKLLYLWQLTASPLGSVLLADLLFYHQRAQEILAGDFIGTAPPFYSSTLYPYLVAAIYAVAGVRPAAVYVVQFLLGTLTSFLIYRLGLEFFEPRRALLAGLLAGLYGPFVFAESELVMISWTVFAVAAALLLAARALRGEGLWCAFLCGAACGLGAADKPNVLVLAALVPFWWWLMTRRVRLAQAAALYAGLLVVMAPIMARNAVATGGRFLLSSSTGINLAIGNGPLADGTFRDPWETGEHETVKFQDLHEASLHFASQALGRPAGDEEADRYWRRTALDFALAHPIDEAVLLGRKILLFLNHEEIPNVLNGAFYRSELATLRLFAAGFWLVGPLGLLAALRAALAGGRRPLLLTLFALLYGLSVVALFVCDRYRLPVAPILILFAADALVTLAEVLRDRDGRRAALFAAGLAPLAVLVALPLVRFDFGRDHWTVAEALSERGSWEAALREYVAAVGIRPDLGEIWNNLGFLQARLGHFDDARASFERAARASPGLAYPHAGLADLERDRGHYEAAMGEYRRALQIDSTLVDAWLSLARLQYDGGEPGQARQTLLRGREMNPGEARFDRMLKEIGADPAGR